MKVRITYETGDGEKRIKRDEWHSDTDGFVVAYDSQDGEGVKFKITIPKERVVCIQG